MKMWRRILAGIIAFCMFVGPSMYLVGMEGVYAAEEASGDYEYEELTDDAIEITRYMGSDAVLDIPEEIYGKKVVSIGYEAFSQCEGINKVSIPNGVTNIGDHVFSGCTGLVEITIPSGVTTIGDEAFSGCTGLKEINIPSEVTTIGNFAFSDCTGLEEITIPSGVATIEAGVFSGCTGLEEINIPSGVTTIGNRAFRGCTGLEEIAIPSGMTTIGGEAFSGCTGLLEVTIPSGVTTIGYEAFSGCTGLEEINIPNGVTTIGDYVFSGCTGLLEVTIPSGVTTIGDDAFSGCIGLEKINIPSGVTTIGDNAFSGCTGLVEISIPSGVTTIEAWAFDGCTGLMEISIPSGVTIIKEGTFQRCTGLMKINIPSGVTTIGYDVFSGCTGLVEISIPDEVKNIGSSAFADCKSLKTVYYSGTQEEWKNIVIDQNNEALLNATIHFNSNQSDLEKKYTWNTLADETIEITKYIGSDTVANIPKEIDGKPVTSIGASAFDDCTKLTSVKIPNSVTHINSNAFSECTGLISVEIPDSVIVIGGAAFWGCTGLTSIEIPPSVTRIGSCAFLGCTGLTTVKIPEGVDGVADGTFKGCTSLISVEIPNSVTGIYEFAFSGCTELKAIKMPSNSNVTAIWAYAFEGCTGLTTVEIPNGVTFIYNDAFNGCTSLKAVNIPDSITSIKNRAFADCSNIKDVYYPNTEEQWSKINIEATGNEALLNATKHFKEEKPEPAPEETVLPEITDTKQELEKLKNGDALSLKENFKKFLSDEQIDIAESCIYTWLAEINYAYQYAGDSDIKRRIMKKAGIDPDGNFASGSEQAVTHISVWTKYGPKTLEITLGLGKPDGNKNLYPAYGEMKFKILEKRGLPSNVPTSGRIGKDSYMDMETFIRSVAKSAENSLHGTLHWQELEGWMAANILTDKTVSEIIGNKNGCFVNGTYIVYAKPLSAYSKKVTIACPVDVRVYSMDGTEAGSIVNNEPKGGNQNVQLDVDGDTKIVYLAGDDYYLNLCGTDTGTMKYEVEEIANEEVQRNVQFLELQLKKDMQYEGYVFRPLNIDSGLYALRTAGDTSQKIIYPSKDKQHQALSLFKRVEGLALGQGSASVDAGRTLQMSASISPMDASNPDLQWSTNDESIAKVDSNGMITAVGAGRATITVSTKDGSFLKQFCIIDVAGKKPIIVPDIKPGDNPGTIPGSSVSTSPDADTSVTPDSENPAKPPLEQEPSIVSLSYVLQFNANGGTGLSRATMTLLAGDSPGIMPKAKRKGYTFNGWYTQQKGGTRISGDKPLEQAATLYAQWTKVTAPAKAKAPALKSKKKGQIKVTLKKVAGAAGYQIEYSTSKKFTSAKTKTVRTSANVKTLTGLKAGRKYYVRVRAYKVDSVDSRIYGAYSTVKSVKTKG